ncbi:hotdog family protein [Rhodoferax sp. AJA081-3]|uniref:hotdog family protein n=1 Tax=Rhodoferax sp. AJA081-3 TaxID=2752316 RepID=UPI001FD811A0|nr:hotdog family protein [Rhodoferax sp. AJA081-3]
MNSNMYADTPTARLPVTYPITAIVPHAGKMCLLDRPIEGDAESLSCEVTIREDGLFFSNGGVDGWVGIEYMAQTVAAWAGWRARLRGEAPRIGFLLGSRRYECSRPRFTLGQTYRIDVHRQFQADNGLGQFDCRIQLDGQVVASATLTVFEPTNAEEFLMGTTRE